MGMLRSIRSFVGAHLVRWGLRFLGYDLHTYEPPMVPGEPDDDDVPTDTPAALSSEAEAMLADAPPVAPPAPVRTAKRGSAAERLQRARHTPRNG